MNLKALTFRVARFLLRRLIDVRLTEYLRLPREDREKAARALDIGCQFLLNVNDMERSCMTSDEWVQHGLASCRISYLPHVAGFLIRTDWPQANSSNPTTTT